MVDCRTRCATSLISESASEASRLSIMIAPLSGQVSCETPATHPSTPRHAAGRDVVGDGGYRLRGGDDAHVVDAVDQPDVDRGSNAAHGFRIFIRQHQF